MTLIVVNRSVTDEFIKLKQIRVPVRLYANRPEVCCIPPFSLLELRYTRQRPVVIVEVATCAPVLLDSKKIYTSIPVGVSEAYGEIIYPNSSLLNTWPYTTLGLV
jgi:hypothetical protein